MPSCRRSEWRVDIQNLVLSIDVVHAFGDHLHTLEVTIACREHEASLSFLWNLRERMKALRRTSSTALASAPCRIKWRRQSRCPHWAAQWQAFRPCYESGECSHRSRRDLIAREEICSALNELHEAIGFAPSGSEDDSSLSSLSRITRGRARRGSKGHHLTSLIKVRCLRIDQKLDAVEVTPTSGAHERRE